MPWEAGILPHQHIPKGTTGSAAPAARSPWLNDGKHLSVGRRRAHNTFLVLLHDRGRRRSNFHGEAIGSPEGVAVSDDESPRLPVLQQCNGCRREWQSSERHSENQHTLRTPAGVGWTGFPSSTSHSQAPQCYHASCMSEWVARHRLISPHLHCPCVGISSSQPMCEQPSTGEQAEAKAQMLGPCP